MGLVSLEDLLLFHWINPLPLLPFSYLKYIIDLFQREKYCKINLKSNNIYIHEQQTVMRHEDTYELIKCIVMRYEKEFSLIQIKSLILY